MSEKRTPITPKRASRITVNESVYYQPHGEEAKQVSSSFSEDVNTTEQLYQRKVQVGSEWKYVDLGWVESLSVLVISNQRQRPLVQPSVQEIQEASARIVELSYDDQDRGWVIKPGQSMRGTPNSPKSLRIRCLQGEATVLISAFPG